ncbi:MAG TPA: glycosyltransferase family 4 protein [Pirellulales bacterium]|nr:glycosyltransferase family 4 protein [Pirellulales bacterium]
MDDTLHVLLVTHYYADHYGGVEIVAAELASRLTNHDCRITWAASDPAPELLPDGVRALPMRAWNVTERLFGFPYPLWSLGSLSKLRRAVEAADVVHLHDSLYLGNVVAYLAAQRLGKPVVVTQHVGEIPYRSPLLRCLLWAANHTLARHVLGHCTQTIFIAEQVRRFFSEFVSFRQSPLFVPNGVDLDRFQPADDRERRRLRRALGLSERPALLFVGRFVEKKGLVVLRELAARFAQCDWLFIGWGPCDPAEWGQPNVRAIGRVGHDRLTEFYQAADLLVLPSTGEGFPLVVQEAMACGTPPLISRETAAGCPSIERVIWTAEPTFEGFAERLSGVLAAPDELTSRRVDVADFAQAHWDWDRCAARYAELFHELASDRARSLKFEV